MVQSAKNSQWGGTEIGSEIIEIEEIIAPKKKKRRIKRKIGASPAFNAVDRVVPAINQPVFGVKDGPDMNSYKPNPDASKASLTRLTTFKKEHTHRPRTPVKNPPTCVKDYTPCSIEKRKAISKVLKL